MAGMRAVVWGGILALGALALAVAPAAALQCWQPDPPLGGALLQGAKLPPHPRLRLNDSRLAILNRTIQTDPTAKAYFEGLVAYGETWLDKPHVDCTAAHMSNTQARTTLTIQYNLGLLWRLTGDARFAERAAAELIHVTTNCTTWDPWGLVLAEMTHAVGIGYDWLYSYLSVSQRRVIVDGVTRMGFGEALRQYAKNVFWANCTFNWGIVTNGGLTTGGLAFLDEPSAASNVSAVLAKAAIGIQCPFSSFAPHGAWHEGSMYWQYVAEYAEAVTEALRGIYGTDFGLSTSEGFNETALFRLHMNGPSQNSFDFGDCDGFLNNSAAQYFMGYSAVPTSNTNLRSVCAYEARRLARLIGGNSDSNGKATKYDCSKLDCARLLLDYSASGTETMIQSLPTARLFKLSAFGWEGRNALGFFRSAWSTESEGTSGKHAYLAFKAANGVPNHNDLDGGTFVFEAGGQRWAIDLGGDDYGLPQYFTQNLKYRYGYYRKSTAGHNTLTFNNDHMDNSNRGACGQDPGMTGRTQITLFEGSDTDSAPSVAARSSSPAYAIVDLSAAYALPHNSTRVARGFAFTASYERLFIVDEFSFAAHAPVQNVTWSMHTRATIKIAPDVNAGSAVLSLGEAVLHATILEPTGAQFSASALNLQPPFRPSEGINKLLVDLPLAGQVSDTGSVDRIVVGLSLKASVPETKLNGLEQWKLDGPFASAE